jgi:murein DD-endopeptidase MepM/ murein hydrolase activator NlpD
MRRRAVDDNRNRAAVASAAIGTVLATAAFAPDLGPVGSTRAEAQLPQPPRDPLRRLRPGPDRPQSPDEGPRHEYGSRTLSRGDRGEDVAELQHHLRQLGIRTKVDGRYTRATARSVHRWEAWRYRFADEAVTRLEAYKIRGQAKSGARYERRGHVFPVRGPHLYGYPGSRFGAPRGDHDHTGQDIAANRGTKLVAVHSGRVAVRQYQAGGAGHYLVIYGSDRSDSAYMHMPRRASVSPGDRVLAGEVIGRVGSTGASSGPHLHFELWTRHWYDGGHPYDPLRKLRRWDRLT